MWIQQQLEATGKTQVELAAATGLTPVQVNKILKGGRKIQLDEAHRIRAFFEGRSPNSIQRIELDSPPPNARNLVPVYDVSASAGHGALIGYESVAYSLAFPPEYLQRITTSNPSNLQIISVKGDSMEPVLKDEDLVMLDRSKRNIGYDGMFVVRHLDVLKVKRLRLSPTGDTIIMISHNSALYPPEEWSTEDVEVIGRVIWHGHKV